MRTPSIVTAGSPRNAAAARIVARCDARARLEIRARRWLRMDPKRRALAVDQRQRAGRQRCGIDAKSDDHRHAARAGERRDMAEGAASGERDRAAAAPIGRKKPRRRKVARKHDRARDDARFGGTAPQRREHAVADVGDVDGSRLEMRIVSGFIFANLRRQRLIPGVFGRAPFAQCGEGGVRKLGVFEHRLLKGQNVGPVAFGLSLQFRQLPKRAGDRLPQPLRFFRGRPGNARSFRALGDRRQRTREETRGGRSAIEPQLSHVELAQAALRSRRPPRETPRRPAPAKPSKPARRRGRTRENAGCRPFPP